MDDVQDTTWESSLRYTEESACHRVDARGILASVINSAAINWAPGLFSDVLNTTVFPAAMAGIAVIKAKQMGAFQGAMMKLQWQIRAKAPPTAWIRT